MELFVRCAGGALCALVLVACVCRIDLMRSGRSRPSWFLVYLLFAVFALGTLLAFVADRAIDMWSAAAGAAGLLLFMALTRKEWHGRPAPETDAAELRRADGTRLP